MMCCKLFIFPAPLIQLKRGEAPLVRACLFWCHVPNFTTWFCWGFFCFACFFKAHWVVKRNVLYTYLYSLLPKPISEILGYIPFPKNCIHQLKSWCQSLLGDPGSKIGNGDNTLQSVCKLSPAQRQIVLVLVFLLVEWLHIIYLLFYNKPDFKYTDIFIVLMI